MATYSYDDIYKIYSYRENHIRIVTTQGEGTDKITSALSANDLLKAPKFQLRDERGIIAIPSSGSPRVQLAITRPDNTEDLLDCVIENNSKGIIICPIRKSLTDISGNVKGEIRLITNNAVIKFYGVDFYVFNGVSDSAAAQSAQFSALVQALQQVNAIVDGGSSGTISLDTIIQHNGTKPVASGIIYDFLQANYRQVSFAHEDSLTSYSDGGVYIDDATDILKMYYVRNSNYAIVGILFNVRSPGYDYATQIKIDARGNITTRVKTKESGEADYTWKDWTPVGTTNNIKDGAVTLEKLNSNVKETVPKWHSEKLLTSGGAYELFQNVRKYVSISENEIDTAIDQQTLYSVYYGKLYCILYCVSGTSNRVQYLHESTGKVYYRYQRKSNDVWGNWDDWKYLASQNCSRKTSIPNTSTSGKLWDICWCKIGTKESCYQLTSITGADESPIYNWTRITTSDDLDDLANGIRESIENKIVVFTYTLTAAGWNDNQQSITVPYSYSQNSEVMADVEFNDTVYNQLVSDGCYGLYISSSKSGANQLSLVAHSLGNTPTANITIQVTLTAVTDISQ